MTVIHVDGKEYEVEPGSNLLEALLSAGLDVPYFCWHPAMGSVGACRQCAVVQYANEEDTQGRIIMSCMTPVTDNARFSVATESASGFRESVIENLMLNHPHDCPVCEEGGECHLQDMTVMVGHRDRQYTGKKRTHKNQYLGPLIGHEMNRCITCYRCVRFYQDYAGGSDLAAFSSRDKVYFGRAEDGVLENEFAGNLVDVCPTGVFTDKTLSKHYTRKWDLQSAATICVGCAQGCNTYTSERYGEVRRVHNRFHQDVNGYFLCDRGRFGAGFVNSDDRIKQAGIRRDDGLYEAVSLTEAVSKASEMINASQRVVGIGSARASLESNQALRTLVGADNYCNGMADIEREMHAIILDALKSDIATPGMREVEQYDAILILGEDITNHAPRLALSVRQATRNKASEMAVETKLASWQDAAVRELAQNSLSPLMIATPTQDRLDDVATLSTRLDSADIARLGFAIADQLHDIKIADDDALQATVSAITETLSAAKRPLIISGTSGRNADVMRSAANVAAALKEINPDTGLCLCASECNSVGVALMENELSLPALLGSSPDTVVVLENDLATTLGADFKAIASSIKNLIVIDHLDNATASMSNLVLPAATFAEAEGTYVNNEGRAQRSMAVFVPGHHGAASDIKASYHLLDRLADRSRTSSEVRAEMVSQIPQLQKVIDAAPSEEFTVRGSKIARMSHRASGRTAMLADVSVHEPQQPADADSAMTYSMEGVQQQAPASLRAFTWSPEWNSNQSIVKFQEAVAGKDRFGESGALLIEKTQSPVVYEATVKQTGQLVHKHHIFGSDPLSIRAEELASLTPQLYIKMNEQAANQLGVTGDDGLGYQADGQNLEFRVIIDNAIPDSCLVYPLIPETHCLIGLNNASLNRIDDWTPPTPTGKAQLITTDRAN
jgi:NADH-quinone oxidoreductase subunit G